MSYKKHIIVHLLRDLKKYIYTYTHTHARARARARTLI